MFKLCCHRLYSSRYMVESDISDLIDETMDDKGFSLLYLNCRSLIGNFDKFKVLTVDQKFA
jgi:hypothetical protein